MNEIINKFLLVGDSFLSGVYLRQPVAFGKLGFTYIACSPFTKSNERIQTFKKTGDSRLHLSKRTRWSLLSTWYGLWRF